MVVSSRSLSKLFTSTSRRRFCSKAEGLSNAEITKKRNELFGREKARQLALITRVEKIEVEHVGPPENCRLLMNKGLSTPFNCAMHIQENLMSRSVLALVNGQPWDLHRPLEDHCELKFLHFKDEDPALSNKAFWRTGSFLIGYTLERVFKDQHYVQLCSFPRPRVETGSFVYDAHLGISDWTPSQAELQCMSRVPAKLQFEDFKLERLTVDASLASKMFEDNKFKSSQIPFIAAKSKTGHSVTLYRMDDHVDISEGPLIASTALINRFNITAIHDIESEDYGSLKRVQGLSTPKQLPIHFWNYGILCERAAKLNPAPMPAQWNKEAMATRNNA
ncbi:hypothetical protein CAPTEDRAFT_170981 [Capitella teleta]|uniref:TGS domain-containing protein n=1 Tax=Capitella teleta TaxID=283909 RepID=R7U2R2_CAPTE|nr:hypothetical protein CAPTEDRAFT_170981 [Capitella teleta]|eukprot:ELT97460.1 hypothetical protein CAPTEDRAFT_170981 [Capitella teleta]